MKINMKMMSNHIPKETHSF